MHRTDHVLPVADRSRGPYSERAPAGLWLPAGDRLHRMRRGCAASRRPGDRTLRLHASWGIAVALLVQLVLAGPFELLRAWPATDMPVAGAVVCGGHHAAPDGSAPTKPGCDHQGCAVCQAWAGPLAPPSPAQDAALSFGAAPRALPALRTFAPRPFVAPHSPRGPPLTA